MEAKIRRIVNEVVEGLLSTPDTTFPGSLGNKRLMWTEKNAIPFFVSYNGKITYGQNGRRHYDYHKTLDTGKLNDMVNKTELQGRFWIADKIFSFWSIDEDQWGLVRDSMVSVCKHFQKDPDGAKTYYYDKEIELSYDERYDEYNLSYHDNDVDGPDTEINDDRDPDKWCEYWIGSNKDYIKRTTVKMSFDQEGYPKASELNEYELLCSAIDDTYRNLGLKNGTCKECTIDEFDSYLRKTYGKPLNKFMTDFHSHLRNRLMNREDCRSYVSGHLTFGGLTAEKYKGYGLEGVATRSGLEPSEYTIKFQYDGTPYSINVKTTDKDKINRVIEIGNDKNGEFVLDRFNKEKLNDELTLYSIRIREKYKPF